MKNYILLFGFFLSVLGIHAQDECEIKLKKAADIL